MSHDFWSKIFFDEIFRQKNFKLCHRIKMSHYAFWRHFRRLGTVSMSRSTMTRTRNPPMRSQPGILYNRRLMLFATQFIPLVRGLVWVVKNLRFLRITRNFWTKFAKIRAIWLIKPENSWLDALCVPDCRNSQRASNSLEDFVEYTFLPKFKS